MKITKAVKLEGNHTVWAYVYRNGSQINYNSFDFIFTACMLPWREAKAMEASYRKANEWADKIMAVELNAEHGELNEIQNAI